MRANHPWDGVCIAEQVLLCTTRTKSLLRNSECRFQKFLPNTVKKNSERRKPKRFAAYKLSEQTIIITGGGIVLRKESVEILRNQAVIVWLDGDEETLFARATRKRNRPLLHTKNPRKAFSQILSVRRSLYANIADIRVDTSVLTDEEVAVAILAKLRRMNPKPESPISAKAS